MGSVAVVQNTIAAANEIQLLLMRILNRRASAVGVDRQLSESRHALWHARVAVALAENREVMTRATREIDSALMESRDIAIQPGRLYLPLLSQQFRRKSQKHNKKSSHWPNLPPLPAIRIRRTIANRERQVFACNAGIARRLPRLPLKFSVVRPGFLLTLRSRARI